jgi:hypothetical protein
VRFILSNYLSRFEATCQSNVEFVVETRRRSTREGRAVSDKYLSALRRKSISSRMASRDRHESRRDSFVCSNDERNTMSTSGNAGRCVRARLVPLAPLNRTQPTRNNVADVSSSNTSGTDRPECDRNSHASIELPVERRHDAVRVSPVAQMRLLLSARSSTVNDRHRLALFTGRVCRARSSSRPTDQPYTGHGGNEKRRR